MEWEKEREREREREETKRRGHAEQHGVRTLDYIHVSHMSRDL
jgi:hypothetical protein